MTTPPAEPATGCVHADAVSFTYDGSDSPQLRSITFDVAKGERVAIVGAAGAGKTTLAMSLNGLVPHHYEGELTGTLTVAGRAVASSEIADLVRHVGLVTQDPESQITGRTALEDAAVGPANLGLPYPDVLARAERSLRRVGLADLRDRDTAQMSGGQLQRLAIAGLLAMDPEILVLDEPTSELDPAGAEQLFAVARGISESGRTVLLVAHEPELVAEWAQRLLVLADGVLIYDGSPAGFFTDPQLVERAGLRPPGVVSVVTALCGKGLLPDRVAVPTTVAEAARLLRPYLPTLRGMSRPAPDATGSGPVVVEARGLSYRYPSGVQALTGVDLRIRQGEFVALVGRNGAGKTTFARHLNGLSRASTGSVDVNGRAVATRPVHELATEVGYVFQNPDHQIFASSVREEISFGLKNLGHSTEAINNRVADVLEQVDMPEMAEAHPYRLSRGQRQRLAVASVLAVRPGILVVDEPTTGQDWTGSVAIMELLRSLNEAGHTILVITHDMLLAAQYTRRAVVFDQGRVRADRPTRELFRDPAVL
ncbi:MAG: ABC transporter ATP-binding protein, partial [Micromonosporaceae bacterium]